MKIYALIVILGLIVGCKKATNEGNNDAVPFTRPQAEPQLASTMASEWMPAVKGDAYQLTLKKGVFGFCDETGSHSVNLTTGKQSASTQTCDPKREEVQSSCDNSVQIHGNPDDPFDDISIEGNDYQLNGHVTACDRQGQLLFVATYGSVELIDGTANKVAIVDDRGSDKAVIGAGWIAWQSIKKNGPLRLEAVAKAMEHAKTPK